jgi:hypothetical protein
MNPSESSLQVGDLVMLQHGAAVPPHSRVVGGTIGRVLFLDDDDSTAVTVQFIHASTPVRLHQHDLMGFAESPPVEAPAQAAHVGAAFLQAGDLVELLAVTAQPTGQPRAALRYGCVLEVEDEDGRVAVQVQGRRHPLHVLHGQLRRLDDGPPCAPEAFDDARNVPRDVTVIERSPRRGFGRSLR